MPRTTTAQPADAGELRIPITPAEATRIASLQAIGIPTEKAVQAVLEGPRWQRIKLVEQRVGELNVDLRIAGGAGAA